MFPEALYSFKTLSLLKTMLFFLTFISCQFNSILFQKFLSWYNFYNEYWKPQIIMNRLASHINHGYLSKIYILFIWVLSCLLLNSTLFSFFSVCASALDANTLTWYLQNNYHQPKFKFGTITDFDSLKKWSKNQRKQK